MTSEIKAPALSQNSLLSGQNSPGKLKTVKVNLFHGMYSAVITLNLNKSSFFTFLLFFPFGDSLRKTGYKSPQYCKTKGI